MRLDVGVLGAEQLLGPRPAEVLHLVDDLAAAVVALARDPLRVLVGQPGAESLDDRGGGEILGGDQLQGLLLAAELGVEEAGDDRVGRPQPWLVGDGSDVGAGRKRGRVRRGLSGNRGVLLSHFHLPLRGLQPSR
jgi:hypothetical protein